MIYRSNLKEKLPNGKQVTLLKKAPLTLPNLSEDEASSCINGNILYVKSISYDDVQYKLNIVDMKCTCPEYKKNNGKESGYYRFRNSCIHIYEWIAYAPDNFLNKSICPEVFEDRYFAALERTYDDVIYDTCDNEKIVITLPLGSMSKVSIYFDYSNINIDDDNVFWCDFYYKDIRYAFNWFSGCWTYNYIKGKAFDVAESVIVNKFYPGISNKKFIINYIKDTEGGVVGELQIGSVIIHGILKHKGFNIYLESNVFRKAKINIKSFEIGINSSFSLDRRYFYIKEAIIRFCKVIVLARARVLAVSNRIKMEEFNLKDKNYRVEKSIKGSTLVSDKSSLVFGIRNKKGTPYLYIKINRADMPPKYRMRKINLDDSKNPPIQWVYDMVKVYLRESDSFPWNEEQLCQFISNRLERYKE